MHEVPTSEPAPGASTRRPASIRILATLIIGAISVAALLYVAPLDEVWAEIRYMNAGWVAAAIVFELASCLSYVVLFRRVFPEPPRSAGRQVAWMAMGAGAVLPGGNISSAAATGVLLRNHGIGVRPLVARCAALLCLLTAFGFLVNGLCGLLLMLGVPGGPHDISHTGGPLLVSIVTLGGAGLAVYAARRLGGRAPKALRGIAEGLQGAWVTLREPHWRLLGGAGFFLLDIGALWAACAATGHQLGVLAVIIAYCIGYLATTIPMPAGLGVLDSGLAAALVLYGMKPAASVGAVLVYHAISIWVPGLGGVAAWLPTQRLRRARRRRRFATPVVPKPRALALADPEHDV